MKAWLADVAVYRTFIRNAFLSMLAYRMRYYTGIITYLLFVSVHYFLWKAIFSGRAPGERINGFTLPDMITYIAVGWIARSLYFSTIDEDIDDLVRTGQISNYLLRPVSFHAMMVAQAFGESLFRLCFFSLPIGAVILLSFPVELPASSAHFGLFLLSTVTSFLVLVEINFLVGLVGFAIKSTQGVMRAKYYLVQLFSGLLLPLAFFPGWLRPVLEALPFKLITYVPLQLYLGKVPLSRAPRIFAEQVFWVAALIALSHFFWHRAIRRLTLQGG